MTWIFGYGSLVWRPAFDSTEQRPAKVSGFVRRFWQGSRDHRGVPGAPGRVVTLLPAPGQWCHGIAYAVSEQAAPGVLSALDHREKGGYRREILSIYLDDGRVIPDGLLYRATPDNPDYLGPAPLDAIADQIQASRGPSGENREYLLRLAEALRQMGVHDPHVEALAARVGGTSVSR